MINAYRQLPRSVHIIFLAQIINKFGDFVFPFLTLYLTTKLGLSFAVAGVIVMVSSLAGIPGAFLGGKFADLLGRKKVYMAAQIIAGLSLVPCAVLKNSYLNIIFILLAVFFGGAVRPCINAMIADILPPERRQLGYSLNYLGINIGVALGPMVAGFLFNHSLSLLFSGDALTSLLAVGLVWRQVSEVNPKLSKVTLPEQESAESGSLLAALCKRPRVIILLLINILYGVVYNQNTFSLPIMMNSKFLDQGPSRFGLLMSVNALTVVFSTIWITGLTKKFRPINNLVLAGVLYTVGFGMIGEIKAFFLFVVSTVLWTFGEILMATNFGTYIANNSPRNYRARFSALSNISSSIGAALGTSLMGLYIGAMGIDSVWFFISIIAGIAAILMAALAVKTGKSRDQKVNLLEL